MKTIRYFRFIIITLALLLSSVYISAQTTFSLRGKVTDASTGEPLAAANIRILGTSKGTITNTQGNYLLSIESGEQTLIFSYLAYQSETLHVVLNEPAIRDVQLRPSPIQMPEVLVFAEDPAIEIIRKAIANKRKWMDKLKSYRFEAFTRQTIYRDTSIASIAESYSAGFWQTGDTLREIIKQKRQTENIPSSSNFAAVFEIENFNEDEIKLAGYTFIGPTAPTALDYYDYKLLRIHNKSGYEIYEIKMIPKSRIIPLLEGTIMIADYTFAVMGIELKPNEAFNIPLVSEFNIKFRQQFSLYEDIFWMPTDIRIFGGAKISFVGITFPKIQFEITSVIYDYKINTSIPDTIFKKPRLSTDSGAAKYDSTFWKQNEYLPLTQTERVAYDSLDSTKTLDMQFHPGGITMTLFADSSGALSFFQYIDARFNRTEGFYFGGKYQLDTLTKTTSIQASAGWGFSDQLFKMRFRGTQYFSSARNYGTGAEIYRALDNAPDGNYYDPLAISFSSLIGKNDYRDYFFTSGWRAYLVGKPIKKMSAEFSFISEWQKSVKINTNYSFISLGNQYRANPPIIDGKLRSLKLNLRYGDEPIPLNLIPVDAIEFSAEYTKPSIAKSDFDFTRYYITAMYNMRTFLRSYLFPPTLRLNITAGTATGKLPPQRIFTLDSQLDGEAQFGVMKSASVKEFTGDRFVMMSAEHNFRNVPFLALGIPFLYKKGIELVIHGAVAQVWRDRISITNGWYSEAGFGISKIFDILRLDLTYRFKKPKHFCFTFGIANIY